MYEEILNPKQKELLQKFEFLKDSNYYLAGGTALALQLGHRTSVDFDFYSPEPFDQNKLLEQFEQLFPKVLVQEISNGTLLMDIEGVNISFFLYKYLAIVNLVPYGFIKLSGVEDIAAMKIIAIVQRGTMRDFVDLYYLLKRYSLEQIIGFTIKKFTSYNIEVVLRAITYFKEADEQSLLERGIMVLDKSFSWEECKKIIIVKAMEYQRKIVS